MAKVCRSSKRVLRQRSRSLTRRTKDRTRHPDTKMVEEEQKVYMNFFTSRKNVSLTVMVDVNGTTLTMEVNTSAAVSVMSEVTYKHAWPVASRPPLKSTEVQLRTYSGEQLPVLGQLSVDVHYKGKEHLELVVTSSKGPTLMGRNWLELLDNQWLGGARIHQIHPSHEQVI